MLLVFANRNGYRNDQINSVKQIIFFPLKLFIRIGENNEEKNTYLNSKECPKNVTNTNSVKIICEVLLGSVYDDF